MRTPDLHNLVRTYHGMSDGELLQLSAERDALTEAAREALEGELRARNLTADVAPSAALAEPVSTADAAAGDRVAKRSARVTAASLLLLAVNGGLLWVARSSLLLFWRDWRAQGTSPYSLGVAVQAALAAWGIVTAIGVLRLRPWAQTSFLVLTSLAAFGLLEWGLIGMVFCLSAGTALHSVMSPALSREAWDALQQLGLASDLIPPRTKLPSVLKSDGT